MIGPRRLYQDERDSNTRFEGKVITSDSTSPTSQVLEEYWRVRLAAAETNYEATTLLYRHLVREADGLHEDEALAAARQAQSEALTEYRKVLKVLTELTGKMPEDQSVGTSGSL